MEKIKFTEEQQYMLDVKMAVALITQLQKEGKLSQKAMEKIRKQAKKELDKRSKIC